MAKPVNSKQPPKKIAPQKSKRPWLNGLLIAAMAFVLYANTLKHSYVLDDITVVTENHFVQMGVKGIPTILRTSYWMGYSGSNELGYRPLSLVMLAVEWQLSPGNPFLNHLVNVLLYAFTGFILYLTLRRLFPNNNPFIPFVATLLFVAHPLHTEVVANIKSRDEILSFLFSVCSLYFLVRHMRVPKNKMLIASLLFFFLAIISKENAITVFGIVPLVIYFFSGITTKKNLTITALFGATILFYIALRLLLPEGFTFRKGMPLGDNTLVASPDTLSRLPTAVNILGRYLLLLIFPHPLISDYSYNQIPVVNWSNTGTLLAIAAYLFLIVFAIKTLKQKSLLSFSILYFLITLSIVSNIFFLVGATMAERFLYMPSLGFCIAVACLVSRMKKLIAVALVSTVFILYSFKTFSRNQDWKNNYTLFFKDVQSAPNSCKLQYYYSVAIIDKLQATPHDADYQKQIAQDAIDHLQKTLSIWPHYVEAREQLGYAYYLHGDIEKAKATYLNAQEHGSHNPKLYNNYAVAFIETNEPHKAVPLLKKAIAQNPEYPEALNNLGSAYVRIGKWDEAVVVLQKAIALKPDYEIAMKNIARAYGNMRDFENALKYLERAEQLAPFDPEVFMLKGYTYKFKGDSVAAISALEEYKRLFRNN